jgi:hypothetical protein
MSRRVCLFGELDTYAGSFPQTRESLPRLVEQLKIACLLYDEVIVNTNVFLDHALTLPAFEELSVFTKAGVLWTSVVENQVRPDEYILERAKKIYGENLNKGISKKNAEKLYRIIDNWHAIAPDEWRLIRKMAHQEKNATANILYNLRRLDLATRQASEVRSYLIDIVSYMQDREIFDRNEIIARLGGVREYISMDEFARLASVIQGEYMIQGAHNKKNVEVSLFPGKYIQYLQQYEYLFRAQSLPIDMESIEKITCRLLNSGFSLKSLVNISTDELFLLSQSPDWKEWREYLLSDNFSFEVIKEMNSLKKIHEHLDSVLPLLLKNIDMPKKLAPTCLYLPSPWASLGLALVGSVTDSHDSFKDDNVLVNLDSRKITYKENSLVLEKNYISLLALFASTGNNGTSVETIKQLDIETDLIKRDFHKTWRISRDDNEDLNLARLNRLNVAKNRLNKKLEVLNLGIHVEVGEGVWRLVALPDIEEVQISLEGTPWKPDPMINGKEGVSSLSYPTDLTKMQRKIWMYCLKRYNSFIAAKSIALEINAPDKTNKQVSDIMYKFKKKLSNTPYQLVQSYQGEYMLVERAERDDECQGEVLSDKDARLPQGHFYSEGQQRLQ